MQRVCVCVCMHWDGGTEPLSCGASSKAPEKAGLKEGVLQAYMSSGFSSSVSVSSSVLMVSPDIHGLRLSIGITILWNDIAVAGVLAGTLQSCSVASLYPPPPQLMESEQGLIVSSESSWSS